jgi:hypothetical protein
MSGPVQEALDQLVMLIANEKQLQTTINRWCFSQRSKFLVKVLAHRNRALFGYLSFRTFLYMYLQVEENPADRVAALTLLKLSTRTPLGYSPEGLSLREEMEKITSLPQRLRVLKVSFEAVIRELAERPGPPYRLNNDLKMYPLWGIV